MKQSESNTPADRSNEVFKRKTRNQSDCVADTTNYDTNQSDPSRMENQESANNDVLATEAASDGKFKAQQYLGELNGAEQVLGEQIAMVHDVLHTA